MEVGNITKAANFKSFLHLSYKNIKLLYFVTVLFNIFMRQTLIDDFWGLHKNMNCAFPLKILQISQENSCCAKFSRTPILKNICERLSLTIVATTVVNNHSHTRFTISQQNDAAILLLFYFSICFRKIQ